MPDPNKRSLMARTARQIKAATDQAATIYIPRTARRAKPARTSTPTHLIFAGGFPAVNFLPVRSKAFIPWKGNRLVLQRAPCFLAHLGIGRASLKSIRSRPLQGYNEGEGRPGEVTGDESLVDYKPQTKNLSARTGERKYSNTNSKTGRRRRGTPATPQEARCGAEDAQDRQCRSRARERSRQIRKRVRQGFDIRPSFPGPTEPGSDHEPTSVRRHLDLPSYANSREISRINKG